MGRALSSLFRRRQELFVVAAEAAIVVAAVVLPLLVLALELLGLGPGPWGSLGSTVAWPRLGKLLVRSFVLSTSVTAACLFIGVPLAVLVTKTNVVARRAMLPLHAIPMFVPPFLIALGWFYLLGQQGFMGGDRTARWLFSDFGVIAVLSLTFAPIVTSLVSLGLRGIDPHIEEAARLVARPFRVAAQILVPAVWPSIALAALVVFAMTFSELGVPMFLRRDVYGAAVFARLGGVDYAPGEALLLTLPLLALALVLLGLERWISKGRSFAVFGPRRAQREPLALKRWGVAAAIAGGVLAILAVAPVVALVVRAGGSGFRDVRQWLGSSVSNSLASAGIAAGIIACLGIALGHGVARRRTGAPLLDGLVVLAFVTPASVLGTGLIRTYNRPATQLVYGSLAIIILGYVARYAVVGVRTMATAVAQSSVTLEDSAACGGAGYLRRMAWIVVPLHWRSLVGAWLLAFVFCLRDLETAVLFYPAGSEPLTVRIFTLEANGPPSSVAALAVLQIALTLGSLLAGLALLERKAAA